MSFAIVSIYFFDSPWMTCLSLYMNIVFISSILYILSKNIARQKFLIRTTKCNGVISLYKLATVTCSFTVYNIEGDTDFRELIIPDIDIFA